MKRVQDVLSHKGTTAVFDSPETSVYEALQVMAEKSIGSMINMQEKMFLDIITDYS